MPTWRCTSWDRRFACGNVVEALDPTAVFCDSFGIRRRRPDLDLLHELGHAFRALPYENLTKLIKKHRGDDGERQRLPPEVLDDHLRHGTGGTCFALTTLFTGVLTQLGYPCRPVLCDMRHAPDSHCALVVELATGPHLLDPGYLLHRPLLIEHAQPTTEQTAQLVKSSPDGSTYDLRTFGTWRYRVKLAPVSPSQFQSLWLASFDWTMMNGIFVCASHGDGYTYVHNHRLRWRSQADKENRNIRGNEAEALQSRFGISPAITEQAFQLLAEQRTARSVSE